MLNIFISSTIRDLSFVRTTIGNKIETELGHNPVMSESIEFNFNKEDIIKSCLDEVERCDVYVLIIGNSYGSIIEEMGHSITHLEYETAKAHQKPIMVAINKDTWLLKEKAPQSLDQGLLEFINDVASHFNKNVFRFDTNHPEQIFGYVRSQLSLLFQDFLKTGLLPQDVHDIINEQRYHLSGLRFTQSLLLNSVNSAVNYNRILSVFMGEFRTGEIVQNNPRHKIPLVSITNPRAATIYKINDDGMKLNRIGEAGNIGQKRRTTDVSDGSSFVSLTFSHQEFNLFMVEEKFSQQKELILCIPLQNKYVLTLHFFVEKEYQKNYDLQLVMDGIFYKNQHLIDLLNLFLEKGEEL
jgi:hypothetical protein